MSKIFKFILNKVPRPWLIKLSYLGAPILYQFYKGTQFIDPIDEKSYRKFLPYGYEKQRKNALSPGTLSLERHRLMWIYLKKETDFFTAPKKILHVAPEQCFIKRFKALKNLEYITTDLLSPIVDVKADILDLPFENNSFDIIFCNHVLEHIIEDRKAMNELYRVMKPKGWGIVQVPIKYDLDKTYEDFSITDKEERKKHFGQYDHVRWYGMDYFDRLANAGFKVEQIKYFEKLSKEEIHKYGLDPHEILPIIQKI